PPPPTPTTSQWPTERRYRGHTIAHRSKSGWCRSDRKGCVKAKVAKNAFIASYHFRHNTNTTFPSPRDTQPPGGRSLECVL
uniref:Uncharacterized protein n=1 Tax=Anopheles quadriannulatus TaxID=34691 RepID=A0A182XR58_ANOQN